MNRRIWFPRSLQQMNYNDNGSYGDVCNSAGSNVTAAGDGISACS